MHPNISAKNCSQIYNKHILANGLVQAVGNISEVLGITFPGCTINNGFALLEI